MSEENKSPPCGDGCSDCFGGCSSGQGCGEGSGENKLPVISLDTPCGVVQIPSYYQRIASSPDDPKASAAFAARSKEALCLFLIYPCPKEEELPYDHPEELISSIHEILGDNQGLVEVNAGKTDHEVPYIYSIVRTLGENHLQAGYTLTMNLRFPGGPVCIQGFFDPSGTSGMREAQTLEYAMQKGYVDKDMKGWARDPYDPAFKKGALTNFSELPGFDSAFPEHPLSLCRELADLVTMAN